MKNFVISFLFFFFSSFVFAQTTQITDTTKITTEKLVVRGIDISNASSGEQSLIMYMESLPDDKFLKLVDKLVVGEIVYKKD